MTVDIRCEIFCQFGPIISGGISDNHVQDNWLIQTKGTLIIDRVFTPRKGRIVQMAYRRGTRVAPFPRFLTVLSSTSDPYRGITTVEVGCPLTLLEGRKERRGVSGEVDAFEPVRAPAPVRAQAVLNTCITRLGLTLTADSYELQHRYLWDEVDLSEGYVAVIRKLIESETCFGHVTREGLLRIRKLRLQEAEAGPLFGWQDLASIQHMPGAGSPPDGIEVVYNGREAPGAASGDWYPVTDDGLGSVDDWNATVGDIDLPGAFDLPGGGGFDRPDATEDNLRNWELERTVSSGNRAIINYTNSDGDEARVTFIYTAISETQTKYARFDVYDSARGRRAPREYVVERTGFTTSHPAASNGSLVKWTLENGGGASTEGMSSLSTTRYSYQDFTSDGPRRIIEETTEYISQVQFVGSLGISDYTGFGTITGWVLASITRTVSESQISGAASKTTVSRWMAWGLSQEGSQLAAAVAQDGSPTQIQQMTADMQELIFDGIETRTSSNGARASSGLGGGPSQSGRQFPQTRPSLQEILADEIDPRGTSQKIITRQFDLGDDLAEQWQSPMNDSEDAVTLRVQVPLSPDDTFSGVSGGGTLLRRGGATLAAQEYGEAVMGLAAGHAWGLAVVGDPWRFPGRPLRPIYITHAGVTNCYRMNGTSWVISNNGLAVGSDVLLCGTTGAYGGDD